MPRILPFFLLALGVRLAFCLVQPDALEFPDERVYDRMARGLLEHGRLEGRLDSRRPGAHEGPEVRRAFWPPAYPVFLAGSLWISGGDRRGARVLQAALSSVSVVLAGLLAARLAGTPRAAPWAMLISALYPSLVFYSGLFLTETLAVFLLLAALLMALEALRRGGSFRLAGVSGALLGVLTMTRSGFFVLPLILAPLLVTALIRAGRVSRGRAALAGVLLLAGALAAQAPWWARNRAVLGRFVPLTTHGGDALYEAIGPGATGGPRRDSMTWPREVADMGEVQRNSRLAALALEHAVSNPAETLRLSIRKLARTWSPVLNARRRRSMLVDVAMMLSFLPVMALFFVGLVLPLSAADGSAARSRTAMMMVVAPVVWVAVLHSVFLGSVRYRVVAMAVVVVVAGMVVDRLKVESRTSGA